MSLIESFDNSFTECLLGYQQVCRNKGGQIGIYGVQTGVLIIFFIIQLDKRINIYNNETDAINNHNLLFKRRFRVV